LASGEESILLLSDLIEGSKTLFSGLFLHFIKPVIITYYMLTDSKVPVNHKTLNNYGLCD
jgi:hypothetical protein